jgi:CO dehydrogenase maturation factor
VIADLEAGIGTLTRLAVGEVDKVIVVSEPSVKSLQAASRAVEQADRVGAHVVLVANRVTGDDDRRLIADAFASRHIVVVPDDERIADADRVGVAPIDHAPDSKGVRAIGMIAEAIARKEDR